MDETAGEGAGRRKIHKSEDLPKPETELGEKVNPQADANQFGDFFMVHFDRGE
jgi:hypothetical protein